MIVALESLGQWWIDYLVAATLALGMALVARRMAPPLQARRWLAWLTAFALIILAPLVAAPGRPRLPIHLPWNELPWADATIEPAQVETLDMAAAPIDVSAAWMSDQAPRTTDWRPEDEAMEQSHEWSDPEPAAVVGWPSGWALAGALFLCGISAAALRTALGCWGLRSLLRRARPVDSDCHGIVSDMAAELGRTKVLECDALLTPAAAGVWRPVILLPTRWLDGAGDSELVCLLRHEQAHLRSGDLAFRWLDRLLESLLFIHPLYLLWRRGVRLDQELSADAYAAGDAPEPYAAQLLQWTRLMPRAKPPGRWAPGLAGAEEFLTRRITTLLSDTLRDLRMPLSRRRRIALALLVALASSLGGTISFRSSAPVVIAAEPKQAAKKPADELIDVSGKVIDEAGKALTGVDVELWEVRGRRPEQKVTKVRSVRTDADGRFALGRVAPPAQQTGSFYYVAIRPENFGSQGRPVSPEFNAIPGWAPDSMEIRFVRPTAFISGTVLGPDDRPLEGVQIRTMLGFLPSEIGVGEHVTDANGHFKLPFAKPFDWETTRSIGAARMVSEKYGTIRFGLERAPNEITLKIPSPAILTFKTMDGVTNRPLPGVYVHLEPQRPAPGGFRMADSLQPVAEAEGVSGPDGTVRLIVPGSGNYNVLCDSPKNQLIAPAIADVEVIAGQTQALPDVVYTRGAKVKGQIVDAAEKKPLQLREGERLAIGVHGPHVPTSSPAVTAAQVNPDGTFEMQLPPGVNELYLMDRRDFTSEFDGVNHQTMKVELKEGETRELQFPVVRKLPPEEKEADNNKQAATKPAAETIDVAGKVVDEDKKPLAGVDVELWTITGTYLNQKATKVRVIKSDEQGRFALGAIAKPPAGNGVAPYVIARSTEFGDGLIQLEPLAYDRPGRSPGALELRLVRWKSQITGVVLGPDDKPLPGVRLCSFSNSPPEVGLYESVTDSNGRFRLRVREPFTRATSQGLGFMRMVSREFGVVRFMPEKAPDDIVLKFPQPAILTVRTIDGSSGRPLAGVEVGLQEDSRWYAQASASDRLRKRNVAIPGPEAHGTSDENGQVRLVVPGSGKFNVLCTAPDDRLIAPAIEGIEVTAGQNQSLPDVVFTTGVVIKGQLVEAGNDKPVRIMEGEKAAVGAHGPHRPGSSAAITGSKVQADGTFELRLCPGANQIYLSDKRSFESEFDGRNHQMMKVDLKEGETKSIQFPVMRKAAAPAEEVDPAKQAAKEPAVEMLDVAGKVVDETGEPVAGIDVELWDITGTRFSQTAAKTREVKTDEQGRFSLGAIPKVATESRLAPYVVARADGMLNTGFHLRQRRPNSKDRFNELELALRKPKAAVTGVVLGPDNQPLPGVRICRFAWFPPELGLNEYTTDAQGRFAIKWPLDASSPSSRIWITLHAMRAVSRDFGTAQFGITDAPDHLTLRFPKPAIVTLRTVNGITGQPVAGVTVMLGDYKDQASKKYGPESRGLTFPEANAVSDQDGNVRLVVAGSGKFNLLCEPPDDSLVGAALEGIEIVAGQPVRLPDIALTPGALVKGRLVDKATQKPISPRKDEWIVVSAYGPHRPKSSGSVTTVKPDGSFEMRLAPGANELYLSNIQHFAREKVMLDLKEGETRELDFPATRKKASLAPKKPSVI